MFILSKSQGESTTLSFALFVQSCLGLLTRLLNAKERKYVFMAAAELIHWVLATRAESDLHTDLQGVHSLFGAPAVVSDRSQKFL